MTQRMPMYVLCFIVSSWIQITFVAQKKTQYACHHKWLTISIKKIPELMLKNGLPLMSSTQYFFVNNIFLCRIVNRPTVTRSVPEKCIYDKNIHPFNCRGRICYFCIYCLFTYFADFFIFVYRMTSTWATANSCWHLLAVSRVGWCERVTKK